MSVAAAALLFLAGCAGAGDGRTGTAPVPPDRLSVTAQGGGTDPLRFDLDCAVADHDACAGVIAAVAAAMDDPEQCTARDGGDREIRISGTIGGNEVQAVLERRTDCEIAAYDRAAAALGL